MSGDGLALDAPIGPNPQELSVREQSRAVTQHFATRQLRFFLTAPTPCPYLAGREERKVFAHLPLSEGASVNDALTEVGFRRSRT